MAPHQGLTGNSSDGGGAHAVRGLKELDMTDHLSTQHITEILKGWMSHKQQKFILQLWRLKSNIKVQHG